VDGQTNPDERFDQVESTLEHLANSQRHLLTAQVLLNGRMERAETVILKTAQTMEAIADRMQAFDGRMQALDDKMQALADSQKHTDEKLAALTDIVRNWYERHGNGNSGPHPS
jgi:chromosome segregation ATPase